MYLTEVEPRKKGGIRAVFGEVGADETRFAISDPDAFLKETGLDVDASLPVHVQVQNLVGRADAAGSVTRVTVLLTDSVNVLSLTTLRL